MSVQVAELLQGFIDSEAQTDNNGYFKDYLETCSELVAFRGKSNTDLLVKCINKCMNSSFEKEKGVLLLLTLLPQVSEEALSGNALSWMISCKKTILVNQLAEVNDGLTLRVLSTLVKLSAKIPEVNKEVGKQIVPKFFQDHVRRKSNMPVSVELLDCLHAFMSDYPGPAGEFRADILKLLLSTLEAKADVIQSAARCVALMAKLGGSGKLGISHKSMWQKQQLTLVNILHSLLNHIYEHVNILPDDRVTTDGSLFDLDPVYEDNIILKIQRLAKQFSSVAQFLQAMLLEVFPVPKMVAPNKILDVIVHAQKPTHSVVGTSREAVAVLAVLPSIQIAALRLLESLVLCLGRNMVPLGGLVSYLCSQVVVWTQQRCSDWPYAMVKPYRRTRYAAYCCLFSWLSVAGSAGQAETFLDKSLATMLADIHFVKPTVKLQVSTKTGKGKKRQEALSKTEDRCEKLHNSEANCRLCEQALKTLTLLVQSASGSLKLEAYTSIVETVLTVVAELPVPYNNISCLSGLYQLLLSLCTNPHPTAAPPLMPALSVFTTGLLHPVPQVKATCLSAVSYLEKIIHPTSASLYFPLQLDSRLPTERKRPANSETELVGKKRKIINTEDGYEDESMPSLVLEESDTSDSSVIEVETIPLECVKSSIVNPIIEENKIEGTDLENSSKILEVSPMKTDTVKEDSMSNFKPTESCDLVFTNGENNENKPSTNETSNHLILNSSDQIDINCYKKDNEDGFTTLNTTSGADSTLINKTEVPENIDPDVSQMLIDFNDEVIDN